MPNSNTGSNVEVLLKSMEPKPDHRFFEDRFSDALRVVMYGSGEETVDNFIAEIEDLGHLLAEYDGVKYEPTRNRLSLMAKLLKVSLPETYKTVTKINNE